MIQKHTKTLGKLMLFALTVFALGAVFPVSENQSEISAFQTAQNAGQGSVNSSQNPDQNSNVGYVSVRNASGSAMTVSVSNTQTSSEACQITGTTAQKNSGFYFGESQTAEELQSAGDAYQVLRMNPNLNESCAGLIFAVSNPKGVQDKISIQEGRQLFRLSVAFMPLPSASVSGFGIKDFAGNDSSQSMAVPSQIIFEGKQDELSLAGLNIGTETVQNFALSTSSLSLQMLQVFRC